MMWRWFPFLIFVASCSLGPSNLQSSHSGDLAARGIKRIAVYPLDTFLGEETVRVPYAASPTSGLGARSAPVVVTRHLYNTMIVLPQWQIVSDREVKEVETMVPKGSPETRARHLGQLVYADAVISGRVRRFREREGEALGAKSPASVAFVLELFDVKRGESVWKASFDETQQALTENLLGLGTFSSRGLRWLTAEELSQEGIKKAIEELHQALYRK